MAADNKTFYIEKDTNYALQVEYAANINFDDIKRIAKFFVMQLPEAVQNKIYNDLEHGEQILDSEPQLNMYLYSFGNMHQAKMQHAFSNIGNDWFGNKEIEIIDYGCGQALATMLYHDYLQKEGISHTVSKITLIEPSKKALCRAGLHAKAFYPEAEIHTINKLLNDVAPTEISHSGKPVLHLFSNILDIEAVDLHHLATLAQAENEETDTLWVCVSPFFGNHKDNRIPCFLDILNQPKTYTFQRSKGNWQNQWTINCIIAEQKSEENLSTKVTKEDISNSIRDEYGVLYSPDGKRLLKGNKEITSYTIKEGTKIICDRAFESDFFGNYSLKSIVIPDSVTKIGNLAFSCPSLQSIVIPNSVTEIGERPFSLGINLTSHSDRFVVKNDLLIDLEEKRLIQCLKDKDTIVIPESVTSIGERAFSSCKSLQSIVIPDSVTEIGGWAFSDCKSLQSIVIPDSVTKIGESAFWGCDSLQSIVIPNSVTEIGSSPFRVGIKITSHSNRFVVKDDLLIALEEKRLIQCLKDKDTIVIPDLVTSIGNRAFWSCKSLQSIIIPESVASIGNSAFRNCRSLQSIVIPDSVTSIGDSAFLYCGSLQSIVIPNSVTSIGNSAFWNCRSLQSIVIPDSVTSIGDSAFLYCTSLRSIVIPDSVTKIGNSAFGNCVSLQSIVIPESVTSIGDGAFWNCKSLQSIVIPESVTEIGNKPFYLGIEITSHSDRFIIENDLLIDRTEKRLIQCVKDKDTIVIPDLVTSIGNRAFWRCKSLQSIIIPESVTSIGNSAFGGCESLQSIVIPNSVTKIGDEAFWGCESLQSIVIPNSVTKIGNYAFERCRSLQSIVIPNSVTKIGYSAFRRCESLQSIVIPKTVNKIGYRPFDLGIKLTSHSDRFVVENDLLIDLEEGRLIQCLKDRKHIVIPEAVTKIGKEAFSYCTSLQSIVIPDTVTEIGYGVFSDCSSLQSIVIPESVTEIGNSAFSDCSSLQSIVIPKGKREYFESLLDAYYHRFIKEIDYKKIYNSLGMCYEFGIEHKRDIEKAKEYYAKAKELENKE